MCTILHARSSGMAFFFKFSGITSVYASKDNAQFSPCRDAFNFGAHFIVDGAAGAL